MRLVGVRALRLGRRAADAGRAAARAFVAVFEPAGGQTMAGDLIYTASHPAIRAAPDLPVGVAPTRARRRGCSRSSTRRAARAASVAAAPRFGIAYRPMTDDDLPFVAALYASTRAEEVAPTGWPPEMQRRLPRPAASRPSTAIIAPPIRTPNG